jgi:[ribosomal protein S5]-alanine N-acetyltransferase
MPVIAQTPRLLIRTWTLADVPALMALTREPGLNEFSLSGYENFSEDRAKEWIEKEMLRFDRFHLCRFAIGLRETEELIGISGLFEQPNRKGIADAFENIELNYRYPARRRGLGYATEAARAILEYGFKNVKLTCIYANADLKNLKSHRVLEKLGMKRIGDTEYEGIKAGRWRIDSEN